MVSYAVAPRGVELDGAPMGKLRHICDVRVNKVRWDLELEWFKDSLSDIRRWRGKLPFHDCFSSVMKRKRKVFVAHRGLTRRTSNSRRETVKDKVTGHMFVNLLASLWTKADSRLAQLQESDPVITKNVQYSHFTKNETYQSPRTHSIADPNNGQGNNTFHI